MAASYIHLSAFQAELPAVSSATLSIDPGQRTRLMARRFLLDLFRLAFGLWFQVERYCLDRAVERAHVSFHRRTCQEAVRQYRQRALMTSRAAFLVLFVIGCFASLANPPTVSAHPLAVVYPPTPRGDVADTYFGTRVSDPYRWLEQTQSLKVNDWVALESELTSRVLARISEREAFRSTVLSLMSSPYDGVPDRGKYAAIFSRNVPDKSQPVIMEIRNGRTSTLIDPNLRWHGTSTFLAQWYLSPDGRTLAYATNVAGGGWLRWHTLSTVTGVDSLGTVVGTPDWAPISWARDSSGFYCGGYGSERERKAGTPIGERFGEFFHRVGTLQSSDIPIYSRPDHPDWLPYARESWDGHYLILGAVQGSGSGGNLVAIRALHDASSRTVLVRPLGDAQYSYVDNVGSVFYFQTTANAPRGKIVAIDLRNPSLERDVISEGPAVLEDVAAIGGRFAAHYLHDVISQLVVFDRAGKLRGNIELPGVGTASGVVGEPGDPTGYYTFSSPTQPHTIFSYDVRTNQSAVHFQQRSPFDTTQYVTQEMFATSTGGVRVPVFVAYRRGLKRDHTAPTMLTGYGGFGDAYHPVWQNLSAAWLASGGVFAIACVRGAGNMARIGIVPACLAISRTRLTISRRRPSCSSIRVRLSSTFAAYGYSGGGLLRRRHWKSNIRICSLRWPKRRSSRRIARLHVRQRIGVDRRGGFADRQL